MWFTKNYYDLKRKITASYIPFQMLRINHWIHFSFQNKSNMAHRNLKCFCCSERRMFACCTIWLNHSIAHCHLLRRHFVSTTKKKPMFNCVWWNFKYFFFDRGKNCTLIATKKKPKNKYFTKFQSITWINKNNFV